MWLYATKRSSLELGKERKDADELLKKLERQLTQWIVDIQHIRQNEKENFQAKALFSSSSNVSWHPTNNATEDGLNRISIM